MYWSLIIIAFSQLYLAVPLEAQEQAKKSATCKAVSAPANVTAPGTVTASANVTAAAASVSRSASASHSKTADGMNSRKVKLKGEQPDPNLKGYRRIGDFGLNPKKTVGPFPNRGMSSAFGKLMQPMTARPTHGSAVLKGVEKDKRSEAHPQ